LSEGKSEIEVGSIAVKEVLDIAKFCIDVPLSAIPLAALPDIGTEIIRQNLSKDIMGKWRALFDEVAALGQGVLPKK
jgi:hypothetical protein